MNIERNFRHAHDLPPMRSEDMIGSHIDPEPHCSYGWRAIIVATAILLAALAFISKAGATPYIKNDPVMAMPEVGTVHRPESGRCKYRTQGSTLAPVLVCKKVKA